LGILVVVIVNLNNTALPLDFPCFGSDLPGTENAEKFKLNSQIIEQEQTKDLTRPHLYIFTMHRP